MDFTKTYLKNKDRIDAYKIQGFLLKQIAEELKPHLTGVLDGVAVETRQDASAVVYLIDDSEDERVRLKPWKSWKDGEFTEMKGRRVSVEPTTPPGKSVGMFMIRGGRVAIPLIA